ncbi:hypothetical protein KEM54_005320 [Ascosphaera aggregata]|nr:hypothetical protein KEM54_005320 [Ascosphaera aggregata]
MVSIIPPITYGGDRGTLANCRLLVDVVKPSVSVSSIASILTPGSRFSMLELANVDMELLAKYVGSRSIGRGSMSASPRLSISSSQHLSRSSHIATSMRDDFRRNRNDEKECENCDEEGDVMRLLLAERIKFMKKEVEPDGLDPADDTGLPAELDPNESDRLGRTNDRDVRKLGIDLFLPEVCLAELTVSVTGRDSLPSPIAMVVTTVVFDELGNEKEGKERQ